jgi:hypothetical protein
VLQDLKAYQGLLHLWVQQVQQEAKELLEILVLLDLLVQQVQLVYRALQAPLAQLEIKVLLDHKDYREYLQGKAVLVLLA